MIAIAWFKKDSMPTDRDIIVKCDIDVTMYVGRLTNNIFNIYGVVCGNENCTDKCCNSDIDKEFLDLNDIKYWAELDGPKCKCGGIATTFMMGFNEELHLCSECAFGPQDDEAKFVYRGPDNISEKGS